MRLDFNILWVEDQQGAVQAQRERIELQVRKEGFRLQVVFASSLDDAKQYLSNDIYGDHIDLVLMDYDLGAGGRGDQGLVEVRNIFPYKDIVFYSSQASDLMSMVEKRHVQGVFCSPRDDLTGTVEGLFESLVKKVLDIDHSRGIVMGATSDIDHYVNDCLSIGYDKGNEICQKNALSVVEKHLEEKRKTFERDAGRLKSISHVSELQQFHQFYTSNDRLRLLKNILKDDAQYSDVTNAIGEYLQNTVPRRNELAHVRVRVDGFSRKLFDKNDHELTSEAMKTLRRDLLEFQDIFERLCSQLHAE